MNAIKRNNAILKRVILKIRINIQIQLFLS